MEKEKDLTTSENETILVKVAENETPENQPASMNLAEGLSEAFSNSNQINESTEQQIIPSTSTAVSFETKSEQEGRKFSGTLSYEDILSQTSELTDIKKTDIDYLAEESRLRREKIQNLDEHLKDLHAQPLSPIDSYSNSNLVLNKSIWNYNEVEQRKTKLQVLDLALLTHIFIYDGVVVPLEEVQKTINNFITTVQTNVISGYPVILNSSLIVDVLRFDKSKIIPITIANPKLIPPMGVIEWQTFVPNDSNSHLIIETFIKLLDNELNNGHECEFYPGTILVRNASGITSLFISESAGATFNSLAKAMVSNRLERSQQ